MASYCHNCRYHHCRCDLNPEGQLVNYGCRNCHDNGCANCGGGV